MPIPIGYVKDHCRIGQGMACCRYLTVDASGFCCAKVVPSEKESIDLMAPNMVAKGDNCPGWTDDNPWIEETNP